MTDLEEELEQLLGEELVLSKTEAGKRQLESAIRMYFEDYDPVATHTVASAAYEVIRGLCHHQGKKVSIKDSSLIEESQRKEYINKVNISQNFFKHSDKDPTNKLLFKPKASALFILDAIVQYNALEKPLTYPMRVFLVWAQLMFPSILGHLPTEEGLQKLKASASNPHQFKLLAKVLLNKKEVDA
jgi:hypothetical protein